MGHKERSLCSSGPVSESTCLHVSRCAPFPPFLAHVCSLPVRPAGPAVASCPLSPTHSCCSSAPQPVPPKPASEVRSAPRPGSPGLSVSPACQGLGFAKLAREFFQTQMLNPVCLVPLCTSLWSKAFFLESLLGNIGARFGQARTQTVLVFLSLPLRPDSMSTVQMPLKGWPPSLPKGSSPPAVQSRLCCGAEAINISERGRMALPRHRDPVTTPELGDSLAGGRRESIS